LFIICGWVTNSECCVQGSKVVFRRDFSYGIHTARYVAAYMKNLIPRVHASYDGLILYPKLKMLSVEQDLWKVEETLY
jgi:hypothetical protein